MPPVATGRQGRRPTCKCTHIPACRHDHKLKQTPGWALKQDKPGYMTWTTPGKRSYTTEPTSYPD
jgi:hypothetical protein